MELVQKKLAAVFVLAVLATLAIEASCSGVPRHAWRTVTMVNKEGPFLGLVVPNAFEMSPILQSSSFVQKANLPYLDAAGVHVNSASGFMQTSCIEFNLCDFTSPVFVNARPAISVWNDRKTEDCYGDDWVGMLNAGVSTQLLLTLFNVKGVVHFGIAGNANPDLQIGDVAIPLQWAHTGLWNWQRYGDGVNDELALEANGDYTRKIGRLNFSDYGVEKKSSENLLNSVWYQPEEVFPVNGVPEVREHAFWVPVSSYFYQLSKYLEGMKLPQCVNSTTCLSRRPVVMRVEKGCSADVFVDNAAYRKFLRSKFHVTPVDMETAAVALVCLQQQAPFVAFRALSDLAGGGYSESNEADVFGSLAAENAVKVVIEFISLLP